MADLYKIAESWMGVWVCSGPGIQYDRISVIYGNDNKEYEVTKRENVHWLKIPSLNGWCCEIDSNGTTVMKKVQNNTEPAETENNTTTPVVKEVDAKEELKNETDKVDKESKNEDDNESYAYVPDYDMLYVKDEDFSNSLENNFTISNLHGIFGMPYQFLENSDPRVTDDTDGIGRKYAKEIVGNMPLLLITPGKPVFMSKYSTKDKKTILGQLINLTKEDRSDEKGILENILDGDGFGKYYSLEYAYPEYYNYVNPMCRVAARVMNVHNYEVGGTKLDSKQWAQNTNKNFDKFLSVYSGCTAWYCESENSISESFSNGTTDSMLASKINGISDIGRELNFILGTVKAGTGVALDKFTNAEGLNESMELVDQMINSALGDTNLSSIFQSITNSAKTVIAGGKLVFPQIWAESSFSRSYNVSLKLVSPDGDDLSVYLNIIVPMLHLLGLVLPRQATDSNFGYISPFLVRAFYKGFFNVDMGIITDLSFSKGKESAWTYSGIPTVVDVNFTITDLYSDMYMTDNEGVKRSIIKNTILMDYISNLCGVNINNVDVYRAIDLYLTQNATNRVKDLGSRVSLSIDRFITNKYQNLFGKF